MRVAVTGLSGFIGRNLAEAAKQCGVEIFAIDRSDLIKATTQTGFSQVDRLRVSNKIKTCDAIIHLAGLAHRRKSSTDEFECVNHHLTVNLAECAKSAGVNRFVYVSSVLVYGNNDGKHKINTQTIPNPTEDYGRSKLNAENGLQNLTINSKHFKVIILRPSLVVGRGARGNLATLRTAISKGIPLPNIADNKRNLMGVRNFVAAILQATKVPLEETSKIFPIADLTPVSTSEIIEEISRGLGRLPRMFSMPKQLRGSIMKTSFLAKHIAPLFLDYEIDSAEAWNFLGIKPEITTKQELFAVGEGIN